MEEGNLDAYLLEFLLDNLEEGICIVDKEGKTIYYNETMERTEGFKKEEVLGKKITEYLKGMGEDNSTLMNALKTGEKYVDVIQNYSSQTLKKITTINSTIPVLRGGESIAAIEISKDMTSLKELHEKLCKLQSGEKREKDNFLFGDIVSESHSMKETLNKALRASLSNSSVLICGETGSGKEVFAQSIHFSGVRKDKPFVPINCAAIPKELLEGMLFGTAKGSFTGAENKKGLFEEANHGTILLDEINSMDVFLQSKLLRVLQEGYIRPLGSNKNVDVDVRIIATLNEEPEKLMKEGRLRKDFYYRLGVIRIDIPPLRERREDIEKLTNSFIESYNRLLGKRVSKVHEKVLEAFLEYSWPGNIRELKNVIESAMNMIDNSTVLSMEYFDIFKGKPTICKAAASEEFSLGSTSLPKYLEEIEKAIIKDALASYGGNIKKTAEALKITRQGLQYKIKSYELP